MVELARNLRAFSRELKRRRVFRVAALYAVVAVGVIAAANDILPNLQLPAWTVTFVVVLAILGFPIALVLAWTVDVTPEGIRRTPDQATSPAALPANATAPASASSTSAEATSPAPELSVAVLPFANLSPDAENEYFSDGLTEEIIADLSAVQALKVISRTSVMAFKGTTKDVRTIGRELGVRYILEGSVRKAGDSLRVTAQLIDAATDVHLWASKYDGTAGDVFAIQESVSRAIIAALRIRLTPQEDRGLGLHPVMDVRAFDCYLQARAQNWRSTRESIGRALQLTRSALEIVGENATLYAALGQSYFQFVNMGIDPDPAHLERAAEAAQRALALEPASPVAHVLQGELAWKRTGDMRRTIAEMQTALLVAPNNLEALLVLPYVYSFCGKSALGRPLVERLLAIDPLTPLNHGIAAYVDFFEGRFEAAIPAAERMYRLDPDASVSRWIYTVILGWAGRIEESPWNAAWARSATPDETIAAACQFLNLALLGDPAAPDALTPAFVEGARWDEQLSWHIGSCYALLGRTDECLDWLENARTRGFLNYPFLARHDPFLEGVRRAPRFQALLERVRADWAALDVPFESNAGTHPPLVAAGRA